MTLGQTIFRLRTQHNMSQEDFAAAMEVSRQSVSKWENGTAVPELDKLIKMSRLFGITLDELATGRSPEKVPLPDAPPTPTEPIAPPPKPESAVNISQTAIGIALLCCSILSLVLFLIFFLWLWIPLVSLPLGILSVIFLNPGKDFRRKLFRAIGWILLCAAVILLLFWAILFTRTKIEHTGITTPVSEVIVFPD